MSHDENHDQLLDRIDSGRALLRQLGLSYPGGDACPRDVVLGLATILDRTDAKSTHESDAIDWLEMWTNAGADMVRR